jgi:hypothetical protein
MYCKEVVSLREVLGIVRENGVYFSLEKSIKDSFGLVLEIGQFLTRDLSDDIEQIRESGENLIIELAGKFE